MTLSPPRKSCTVNKNTKNILTAPSMYVSTLLQQVVKNKVEYFVQNYDDIYNTRHKGQVLQYLRTAQNKVVRKNYILYGDEVFQQNSKWLKN